MCTLNENHMMYGSSDMARDRQDFFFPNNPANQHFEK